MTEILSHLSTQEISRMQASNTRYQVPIFLQRITFVLNYNEFTKYYD